MSWSQDPFAVFGMEPGYSLDLAELERRYRELQRTFHPDRHAHQPAAVRRMNLAKAVEVNEAYRVLCDDLRRAEVLLARFGVSVGEQNGEPADQSFLMEVMERRELLSQARRDGDLSQVRALGDQVASERDAAREEIAAVLQQALTSPDQEALRRANAALVRLRYCHRLLDEVAFIEEEALGL